MAGALQDWKRAVILGTKTFGKGSVQTILPLTSNTALKLTTARYFTPSGRSIQAKGIVPDVVVPEDPNVVDENLGIRESDLEKHLSNPNDSAAAKPVDKPVKKPETALKPATKVEAHAEDGKEKPDYQLDQAIAFLKGGKAPKSN